MASSETPNEELQEALEAAEAAKAAAEAAQRKADELAAAAEAAAVAEPPAAPADTPREHSELAAAVIAGYSFEGSALEMGALVEGDPNPDARVRIPFGMLNRHGLVAGGTPSGKK